MLNRTLSKLSIAMLFGAAVSVASSVAYAQDQQLTPAQQQQQDLQEQVRQMWGGVMQIMQAKGIDPGQFFQQMRQGADMADIQKQLIDQGLLDPQTAANLQATMQKLTTLRLRDQLQCSDAEYAVMDPLIQKVIAAQNAVGEGGGMRMGGFMSATRSPAGADVSKAQKALHVAIPNTTPDQFVSLLKDLRDARDKAKDELINARRDLVQVLNVRQEAALTQLGILE
jgi:hypothetical protein